MLKRDQWLKDQFDAIRWPVWLAPMSNTVYFKRPPEEIAGRFHLSPDFDDRLGGALSHIVVTLLVSLCFGLFAFTCLLGFMSFSEICANRISRSRIFIIP